MNSFSLRLSLKDRVRCACLIQTFRFKVITYTHMKVHQCRLLRMSYIVARRFRPDGVFSSQSDAAHGDNQQDAHLKVTQGADVVTCSSKPESRQRRLCYGHHSICSVFCSLHARPGLCMHLLWLWPVYQPMQRFNLRVGGGQDEHGAEGRHGPGSSFTSLLVVVVVLVLLRWQRLRVGVLVDWIRRRRENEWG